jgi:hypothetical protein
MGCYTESSLQYKVAILLRRADDTRRSGGYVSSHSFRQILSAKWSDSVSIGRVEVIVGRLTSRVVRDIEVGTVSTIVLLLLCGAPVNAGASRSRVVPTCFHNQLEVAVAWDEPPAMGSNGIPFIIANTSKSSCSIEGFPGLSIDPDRYKNRTVKVIKGGGGIFLSVKPRPVVIKPGADASFGLNFGDGSNQQDPIGAACTTQNIFVTLPVRVNQFPQNYETTVNFDFCAADFEAAVTPFESGPLPKEVRGG